MGGSSELGGPDFAAGVPTEDVTDVPLPGRVGDEAALAVRVGERFHVVGASCTHYGGPLAEGVVEDGTIRCPWHHACFDLATGAARAAPALSPIPCWEVEVAAGRLRALGKRDRVGEVTLRPGVPASIVIVGAGAAGHAAAERLRELGYTGSLTLVGAEATPPVDRPNLSKDYLAGNAPEEWIPLRPRQAYVERGIELLTGVEVTAIDPKARVVSLSDGRSLSWERLLLATGAEPIRLTIPGAEQPHVSTLRTLADSRAIIAAAATAKRVVVVGASFIGLEAAAALRTRGLAVTVVAPEARPLERVLGERAGDFVRALHEQHGVEFRLGDQLAAIGAHDVTLASGGKLPADLVVVGIGVRPNLALAEKAGLAVDRGVTVDATLRTSLADVYAAGDVARCQGVRIEHWVVAQRMGQTAAHNLLGEQKRFTSVPFFWSAHYDVTIAYVGHAEGGGRVDVHGELAARDATLAYRQGGQTLAVATIGRDRVSLAAELAFERGDQAALAAFGVSR